MTNPAGFGCQIQGTSSAFGCHQTDAGPGYSVNYDVLGALNGGAVTGTLTIATTNDPGGITGFGVIPFTLK